MSVHTMAAIRNARGLTPEQKTILYTVESRGEVFSNADTLRADCGGMSPDRFYRHRNPLVKQGLLLAERRGTGRTTRYRVAPRAIAAMGRIDDSPRVLETMTPESANQGHQCPQNEDTKHLKTRSQREPLSGPPKGSTQGDPLHMGSVSTFGVLHHIAGPLYVRLVRTDEMSTPEKHIIGDLTSSERSEWIDRIDAEASQP